MECPKESSYNADIRYQAARGNSVISALRPASNLRSSWIGRFFDFHGSPLDQFISNIQLAFRPGFIPCNYSDQNIGDKLNRR